VETEVRGECCLRFDKNIRTKTDIT